MNNRFIQYDIREHTRFSLTADVWEEVGRFIESFPPACFVGNPKLRGVLSLAWKLHNKGELLMSSGRATHLVTSAPPMQLVRRWASCFASRSLSS